MDAMQLAALQFLVKVLAQVDSDLHRRAVCHLIQIAASATFDANLLTFAERYQDEQQVFMGEEMGTFRKLLAA